MKLTIDIKAKTFTIEGEIEAKELIKLISKYQLEDYKQTTTVHRIEVEKIVYRDNNYLRDYNPFKLTQPWKPGDIMYTTNKPNLAESNDIL